MTRPDVQPYVHHLRQLPFVEDVEVLPPARATHRGPDARLRVRTPTFTAELAVQVKQGQIGRSVAAAVIRDASGSRTPWLLMAPAIGEPLGTELAEAGIQFIDLAGNCFVRLRDRYIARVQGKRLPKREGARGIRTAGYRVLFALLAEPALLGETLRTIAAEAGASRQSASDMLERLVRDGFAVRGSQGHRWVEERRPDAIDLWVAGYQTMLRPSLEVGSYRLATRGADATEAAVEQALRGHSEYRFGGVAGAYRLVDHYRGDRTVVFVEDASADLPARLRAVLARDGDLMVLRSPGPVAMRGPHPEAVHPLLVYAELRVDPDPRARELADRIFDRFLRTS